MSILPVPDELPGLKRRPGLTTWQVLDNSLQPAPHPDSAEAEAETAPAPPAEDDITVVDEAQRNKDDKRAKYAKGKGGKENTQDKKGQRKSWTKTLWPTGDEKEKGLEHSLRLYPHLQDTGAFFVCVLVKKGDASVEDGALVDEETSAPTSAAATPAPVEVEEKKVEESAPAAAEVEMKEELAATAEKRERASSPVEGEPDAKKVKQAEGEKKVEEKKDEQIMGAGRPFNEEPYIYLKGHEDEQVQIIRCVFLFLSPLLLSLTFVSPTFQRLLRHLPLLPLQRPPRPQCLRPPHAFHLPHLRPYPFPPPLKRLHPHASHLLRRQALHSSRQLQGRNLPLQMEAQ
jgi:multisite-specific tRNA:(cytosine-C5)-methyltransferase